MKEEKEGMEMGEGEGHGWNRLGWEGRAREKEREREIRRWMDYDGRKWRGRGRRDGLTEHIEILYK